MAARVGCATLWDVLAFSLDRDFPVFVSETTNPVIRYINKAEF